MTNSPQLSEINFNNNQLTSIAVTNYPLLKKLYLDSNLITSTSTFSNLSSLEELNIQNNQITNLQLPALPALKFLTAGSNGYATINLSSFPNLRVLSVNNNNLTTIDFSATPLIQQLNVNENPLSILNVTNLSNLNSITCSSITATELDFSSNPLLEGLNYFNNPNLTHINLKSGTVNSINYNTSSYYNLPNLQYICIDEGDTFTYSLLSTLPTVPITSYCTFIPGGTYNTITGNVIFDANNNGCDASDDIQPNVRVNINDGTTLGASYTSNSSSYTFYTQAGSFDITPSIENSTWFNFSPSMATIPFTNTNSNTVTQNFCMTANGVHNDVEVVIAPVGRARPGFDAQYKIVYKNKGNQNLSGTITLTYNASKLDFIGASILPDTQSSGSLSWNYTNLQPFENRSFYITFHVHAPTDAQPVHIGDILNFQTTITPLVSDENPADNLFTFNQTVVGSFDPNDITCIEGDVVPPILIGDYLHYIINFENTGTATAQNIVVKDIIDTTKYDVSSLQVMNSSNPVTARLSGNVAEFIFQTINLDSGGHGNILLKVKSNNTLIEGDNVTKKADIFFDYNAPISTNIANTIFQSLSNPSFEVDNAIKVYPNPTKNTINIQSSNNIKSIQFYDAQGRILQTSIVEDVSKTLDITERQTGIYYLKITSDKGMKVEKVVKE